MLAYDQRGMGRSSKPDAPYSMAGYADDAAGLMDALGWDEALVIGVSFGGMVAQELVLRHPARVRKLVLACTWPGGAGGASFAFHEIPHLAGEARARHLIPIMDLRHDEAWAAAHPEEHAQMVWLGAQAPFAGEPGHAEGARRQLEARARHDTWDRLDQIACPVLIAAGRHDGIALPETQRNLAAASRARSCASSTAATCSCCRTRKPCPRSWISWTTDVVPEAHAPLAGRANVAIVELQLACGLGREPGRRQDLRGPR